MPIDVVCTYSIGAAFDEECVLKMDGDDSWWNRATMYYTCPEWGRECDARASTVAE